MTQLNGLSGYKRIEGVYEMSNEVVLKEGTRIAIGDTRKELKDRVIAEGKITEIREERGIRFVYLDTGYYITVLPNVAEG